MKSSGHYAGLESGCRLKGGKKREVAANKDSKTMMLLDLPVLSPCPVLVPSPSSISWSRLSILASPSSCANWRDSTICQATLCRGGKISRSSPNLPRCSQVASSSRTWAWKRRCRTTWGLSSPRQSARDGNVLLHSGVIRIYRLLTHNVNRKSVMLVFCCYCSESKLTFDYALRWTE